MSVLSDSGCKDVITASQQKVPFDLQSGPAVSVSVDNPYLTKRAAYFSDSSSRYALYYIPDSYGHSLVKAVHTLQEKNHTAAGIDVRSSFPWIVPVICFLFYILLLLRAENRTAFCIAGFFPVIFSLTFPFYPNAAAVCLILYALYIMQKFWRRTYAVKRITASPVIILYSAGAIIIVFVNALTSGLIFILSCAGAFSAVYILREYQLEKDANSIFNPVYIRPAQMVSAVSRDSVRLLLISAAGIVILVLSLLFNTASVPSSDTKDLSLPVPVRYTKNAVLPGLDDYIIWSWNTASYPYRSLNSTEKHSAVPANGETVTMPEYTETENGITEKDTVMLRFDSSFRKTVVRNIDSLPYPAVEKLMKRQGNNVSVIYAGSGGSSYDGLSLLLLITALFVPLSVFIYIKCGRKI